MRKPYAYLLEEEDENLNQPVDGEESVVEDDEEDSPFERDDVEVTEDGRMGFRENGFEGAARSILKKQNKLGEIKSMTVKVLSLSESRKKQMKKAGLLTTLSIASITAGAAYKQFKNPKPAYSNLPVGANGNRVKDVTPAFKSASDPTIKRQEIAKGAGVGAAAGAALGANSYLNNRNKKTVVIEVSYKYGKKTFELTRITQDEEKHGEANKIFNILKRTIAGLKNRENWNVREDATPTLLKNQQIAQALTEAYLFTN